MAHWPKHKKQVRYLHLGIHQKVRLPNFCLAPQCTQITSNNKILGKMSKEMGPLFGTDLPHIDTLLHGFLSEFRPLFVHVATHATDLLPLDPSKEWTTPKQYIMIEVYPNTANVPKNAKGKDIFKLEKLHILNFSDASKQLLDARDHLVQHYQQPGLPAKMQTFVMFVAKCLAVHRMGSIALKDPEQKDEKTREEWEDLVEGVIENGMGSVEIRQR